MVDSLQVMYLIDFFYFKGIPTFFIYIQDILKNLNLATTLLILALVFRKDIKDLFTRITLLKYKGNEVHLLQATETSLSLINERLSARTAKFQKSHPGYSLPYSEHSRGGGGGGNPYLANDQDVEQQSLLRSGQGSGSSTGYSLINSPDYLQKLIDESGTKNTINTLYQEFAKRLSEYNINNDKKDNLFYQTKNEIESVHSFINNYDLNISSSLIYSYQKTIRNFLNYSDIVSDRNQNEKL